MSNEPPYLAKLPPEVRRGHEETLRLLAEKESRRPTAFRTAAKEARAKSRRGRRLAIQAAEKKPEKPKRQKKTKPAAVADPAAKAKLEEVRRKVVEESEAWWRAEGPRKWEELHRWTLAVELSTPETVKAARRWLAKFFAGLPCGKCKGHATEYHTAHPVEFADNLTLARWAWAFHNDVNARLGKPVVAWEAAVVKWSVAGTERPAGPETQLTEETRPNN